MKTPRFFKLLIFFAVFMIINAGCKSEPKYLNPAGPTLVDISAFPESISANSGIIISEIDINGTSQLVAGNPDSMGNPDGSGVIQLTSLENGVATPIVSPDGKHIAFIPGSNGVQDLYVIGSDGTGLKNFTNGQFPYIWVDSWSPDSRFFAFSVRDMQENEKWQLFKVDINTGEITHLIYDAGSATSAAWSPDGSKIALNYSTDLKHGSGIYLINSDGSNLRQLSRTIKIRPDYYPAWSPDGTRIAYTAGTVGDLFIMNVDGSSIQQYHSSSCKKEYTEPQWLPDNQHILVQCYRGNDPAILEVIDSTAFSQPSIFLGEVKNYYSLSPDGKYVFYNSPDSGIFISDINGLNRALLSGAVEVPVIAWVNNDSVSSAYLDRENSKIVYLSYASGNTYINSIKPDGSDLVLLSSSSNTLQNPIISPDGQYFLFLHYIDTGPNADLYSMKSDGSELENLTNGQYDFQLGSWSPDSQHVVFSALSGWNPPLFKLYIADILTGDIVPVSLGNGLSAGSASWSPDGQQIAFRGNYWLLQSDGGYVEDRACIYLVNPDGSNLEQITNNSSDDASYPQWSPDGLRIAYYSNTLGGTVFINRDGSNPQLYITSSCDPFQFDLWSPDNKHLLGRCYNGEKSLLAIIDSNDFSQAPTIMADGWNPSFSPGGNFIAYATRDGIFYSDVYGENQKAITKSSTYGISWSSPTFDTRNSVTISQALNIPTPTPGPVLTEQEMIKNACGNSYWPIVEGASWVYRYASNSGEISDVVYSVTRLIPQSATYATFEMNGSMYFCDHNAIYRNDTGLLLPAESQIFNGNQVIDGNSGIAYSVSGPISVSTLTDTYESYEICNMANPANCTSWARDVGKVASSETNGTGILAFYSIPSEAEPTNQSLSAPPVQVINAPVPTPETASISSPEGCNNPYWPIIQGAWWKYIGGWGTGLTYIDTIESISFPGGTTNFVVREDISDGRTITKNYYCNENGVYDQKTGYLLLPPERLLTENYQWSQPDGQQMSINFLADPSVFTSVNLSKVLLTAYVGQVQWDYYAYNVGPAGWGGGEWNIGLVDYYLPPVVQNTPAPVTPAANDCTNPYWPVSIGAKWDFGSPSGDILWEVIKLDRDSVGQTYFTIRETVLTTYAQEEYSFYCLSGGVYTPSGMLILPSVNDFYSPNIVNMDGSTTEPATDYKTGYRDSLYESFGGHQFDSSGQILSSWIFLNEIGPYKVYRFRIDPGKLFVFLKDNTVP